ncbi:MAG: BTAD domain-containing putative transcriptional regulator [Nakamurella sp.]
MRIDLIGSLGVHNSTVGDGATDSSHAAVTAQPGAVEPDSSAESSVTGAELGGRRARLALASLALSHDVVPPDTLAAHIWGDEPPPTWPVALRGLIRALRFALRPVGGDGSTVIVTDVRGYRLGADVTTDIDLAAAGLNRAAELAAAGRSRAAVQIATPISGINGSQLLAGEDVAWIAPHRQSIDAMALRANEIVIDGSIAVGDFYVAVAAARRAVAANPLDERCHRALIRALDASGDRAGAVHAYELCRAAIADELGIDPSAETTQAYLAALGGPTTVSSARLPRVLTSFHARGDELGRLDSELAIPGLVVLSGRGGVGKSRLALEAARAATHFEGGRFWVSLSSLGEDDLVASTVAIVMGVGVGADDPTDAIVTRLAPLGRTLLVLDGCEQVTDGAGSLAGALMANCPALTVLATTRIPLSVEGVREEFVGPLPMPGEELSELAGSQLVALLAARMHDAGRDLTLDAALAPHLHALLQWSSGLPLAVELVAAQLVSSSLVDLLEALPDGHVAPGDILRGIASASYQSLTEDEAAVFRRFAVLDGEVTLPILRKVVSGGAIPALRIVRVLRELVARGLIGVDSSGARWRYSQDDDLRRFATELLAENGEELEAFDRLAEALRALLPDDPREPPAAFQDAVTESLALVRSLLRAGLAGRADRDRCLELAFRLHRYWAATNVGEGRFWLGRLLAVGNQSPWTAYATYALGYLDYWLGATDAAVTELRTVVDLLGDVDDPYKARALIYLAGILDDVDRGLEAVECVQRAIAAAAPFGPDLQVAAAMGMGSVLSERGRVEAAVHAAAAIVLCREHGSTEQLAAAMPTAAMITWQVGELDAARGYISECLPMHRQARRIARVVLLSAAAGVALADSDIDAAVDFGNLADEEGTALGVEREMPLIRSILARANLAAENMPAAIDRSIAAIEVALCLEFTFPLATCLETAGIVLAADLGIERNDLDVLLSCAARIRVAGDRPSPVTLAPAVERLRRDLSADIGRRGDSRSGVARSRLGGPSNAAVVLPRDAAQLALRLLRGRSITR